MNDVNRKDAIFSTHGWQSRPTDEEDGRLILLPALHPWGGFAIRG
jgi:hypothetical protein